MRCNECRSWSVPFWLHFGSRIPHAFWTGFTCDVLWCCGRSDEGRVNTLDLQTTMVPRHAHLMCLSFWYIAAISRRAQLTRSFFSSLTSRPFRTWQTITGVVLQVLLSCRCLPKLTFLKYRECKRPVWPPKLVATYCNIWLVSSWLNGSSGSRKRHCEVHDEVFRHKRPKPQMGVVSHKSKECQDGITPGFWSTK